MVSTTTPSCADLDQTMAINSLVANMAFAVVQNWYYAKPISTHKISISLSHGCIAEFITPSYLVEIGESRERHSKKNTGYNYPVEYFETPVKECLSLHRKFDLQMKALEEKRLAKEAEELDKPKVMNALKETLKAKRDKMMAQ